MLTFKIGFKTSSAAYRLYVLKINSSLFSLADPIHLSGNSVSFRRRELVAAIASASQYTRVSDIELDGISKRKRASLLTIIDENQSGCTVVAMGHQKGKQF
ncbi:unnamed protein product [Rhodiola kirilowii]